MNEDKLNDFLGKLISDMGAATGIALTYIGDQLGLFRSMADAGPLTPQTLADKTGFNLRLLTEWLKSQAAGGYLEYNPQDDTYLVQKKRDFIFTSAESHLYCL